MTPDYRLYAGDADVTQAIRRCLVELRLTLTSDAASDSLSVTLSDVVGALARPAAERPLRLSLGYAGRLVPMGVYYHSETDVDLVPRRLTVRAAAADYRRLSTLKAPRTRAFEGVTLGALIATIASEHGYAAAVAPALAAQRLAHVDQTAESDLGLLHRIAKHYDATLKAAGGRLVMLSRGSGRSAGGSVLPLYVAERGAANVLSGRVSWRGRPRYASVVASWWDPVAAEMQHVRAGSGTPAFVIREPRPDRDQAAADAAARLARLSRQTATLDLTVVGEPNLVAEGRVETRGWGADTNGVWTIIRTDHTLSASGYRTTLTAEAV